MWLLWEVSGSRCYVGWRTVVEELAAARWCVWWMPCWWLQLLLLMESKELMQCGITACNTEKTDGNDVMCDYIFEF